MHVGLMAVPPCSPAVTCTFPDRFLAYTKLLGNDSNKANNPSIKKCKSAKFNRDKMPIVTSGTMEYARETPRERRRGKSMPTLPFVHFVICFCLFFNIFFFVSVHACDKNTSATEDIAQTVGLYRNAAEQGDAEAQFKLGFCYASGRGVAKDMAQAVVWYRKAAEQGNVDAQCNLGFCYIYGEGVAKDAAQVLFCM